MRKKTLCCFFLAVAAALAMGQESPEAFVGVVVAFRTSMVNAKAIGNVSKIAVQEGQKVAEGEQLAQLDDTLARANYDIARLQAEDTTEVESAQLQLEQAKRDLERVRKMDKTATEVDIQRAEYGYALAAKTLSAKQQESRRLMAIAAARRAALDDYAVRAPFAGIVAQKMIEVGETTAPVERRLFEIIDISRVYIDVHPEVRHIRDLAVGDTAAISCDVLEGASFTGKITFVSPSLDVGSPHFAVKVRVENPGELLRPGMRVSVAFPDKIPAGAADRAPAPRAAAPPRETPEAPAAARK